VLNLTVFASAGTPTIGQTFVIVQLVRGKGAAATVLGTLLQAYVTSTQHLAFPGSPVQSSLDGPGAVRMFGGTQPAAGLNFTEIVPFGARWQLLAIRTRLTTSAVVATRVPILTIVNNAADQIYLPQYRGSPAGASDFYVWAAGTPAFTPVAVGYNVAPLPTDLPLSGLVAVTCTTPGFDVAINGSRRSLRFANGWRCSDARRDRSRARAPAARAAHALGVLSCGRKTTCA
jgi:hypothetical protein